MDEKTIARFWKKVDKDGPVPPHCQELGPCWVWTASGQGSGYGSFCVARKTVLAHRISWSMANGPIDDGAFVLHRCDNRRCVRVSHLRLGTALENSRDMVQKGRVSRGPDHAMKTRPQLGEANGVATLSEKDIIGIRLARQAGRLQADIAAEFRTHQTNVSLILSGKAWAHVK